MRQRAVDYSAGLPDHHDPLAGIGGAPPAQSALTLRLVLACFGLVVCGSGAAVAAAAGVALLCVLLAIAAVVAIVDILVIARRKRRGEPG